MKVAFTGHRPEDLGGYGPQNPLKDWIVSRNEAMVDDCDQHLKKPLIQLIEQYWFQDTVMSVLGVWFDADVRKVFDALRLSTTTSPSILHQINVEFEFQAIMAEILGEGPEAL